MSEEPTKPAVAPGEIQESFGEYLRRNREASGKTLDGISRSTRIGKRYLQAFEDNELKQFPDESFARGFLKSVAREIGMDVDECIAHYDRYRSSLMPTQIREVRKPLKTPSLSSDPLELSQQQKWIVLVLGGGVIMAGLILGGIWLIQKIQPPEETSHSAAPAPDDGTPLSDEKNIGVVVDETEIATNTVAAPAPPTSVLAAPVKPSVLTIKALKDAKISVRVGEAPLQELAFKAGEVQVINVFKDVEIRSADRTALVFQYNGKPLDISGTVIKLFNRHLFSKKP